LPTLIGNQKTKKTKLEGECLVLTQKIVFVVFPSFFGFVWFQMQKKLEFFGFCLCIHAISQYHEK
jgi:hypothetical protein